jgi:8-oxo-dGTP pyrophosphatase MutT (NUDIX family)
MKLSFCNRKCCSVIIQKYSIHEHKRRRINKKAGVFIYDNFQKKVLLIQSKGNLWGMPKGTFEEGESSVECAIRETFEETGIKLNPCQLGKCYHIYEQANYFFVSLPIQDVEIQKSLDNDVNGIGWIHIECLQELVNEGIIRLNHHARLCFGFFLKLNLKA